ncbi:MAG TPA: hypothetical protein VN445_02390 [Rectinemataceae bacterium]|nr:hypothetical protein [Rectinemataceae bacterium]
MNDTTYLDHVRIVPEWMTRKVGRLARDWKKSQGLDTIAEAIGTLENCTVNVLKGEHTVLPALGNHVPADFRKALIAGTGNNLAPLERAAIVIVDHDAGVSTPGNLDDCFSEFLNLKWISLDSLLEGADL